MRRLVECVETVVRFFKEHSIVLGVLVIVVVAIILGVSCEDASVTMNKALADFIESLF